MPQEYSVSFVAAAIIGLALFGTLSVLAILSFTSGLDIETKQHAATIKSMLQLLEEDVEGLKTVDIGNLFDVAIDGPMVVVICSSPICAENYVAQVPHGADAESRAIQRAGKICFVKKKDEQIKMCSASEKECCRLDDEP